MTERYRHSKRATHRLKPSKVYMKIYMTGKINEGKNKQL